jgi:hypothetical protein
MPANKTGFITPSFDVALDFVAVSIVVGGEWNAPNLATWLFLRQTTFHRP